VSKRILVTGATGFLGGGVARIAAAAGWKVAALVRPQSLAQTPQEALVISGSLESPDWKAIEDFRPEVCVHCAWEVSPGHYNHSSRNDSLAKATIAFASELYKRGLRKFIGFGSCAEYESSSEALEENAPRRKHPDPYTEAKLKALDAIQECAPSPSAFAWMRVFYAYGPGEPLGKFISSTMQAFAKGETVTLMRAFDIVDYIHCSDVASAAICLAASNEGGIFNAGSGHPLSVRQVAEAIRNVCGRGIITEMPQNEQSSRFANIQRLGNLGWVPRCRLQDGLAEMWMHQALFNPQG